jgi:hypothetical protein
MTPRVREAMRQIIAADVLEDRLEYDVEMLAECYDLTLDQAQELYAALRRVARGEHPDC